MNRLEGLGLELKLLQARLRAKLGRVPPPSSLSSDLHNIPFTVGERVVDTVTGQEVEVLGYTVRNIESESPET